jgi:hypothetical protein
MTVGATKANWKLPIVVAIVCGVVVFAAGFLHRQAVDDAVAEQQTRSAAIAKAMTKDVAGVDLTKAAKGHDEKALDKSVDPPAGTDIAIFSLDGVHVYATPGARTVIGVRGQIADAAKGTVSRTVDGEDLVVYAPIPSAKKGQLAVAAVVTSYQKLLDNASGPLDAARMPLTAIGVVLFLVGLALFLGGRKDSSATEKPAKEAKPGKAGKVGKQAKAGATASGEKRRVSGFDPVPVVDGPVPSAVEAEPAADAASASSTDTPVAKRFSFGKKEKQEAAVEAADGSKKRSLFGKRSAVATAEAAPTPEVDGDALQREVAIRQALEDQLEQLRTRMHMQEEQASAQIRELRDQLEAQGSDPTPTVGPAEQDMIARIRSMETELSEARETAAQATAQVATMQQELSTATSGGVSAVAAEVESQVRDLQAKLEEAERAAADSEQRAQSIESIRAELEVRVAQLSSKAGELEQKAEELETRLREANEGGDAVREEIASLTAALAAAEARGKELEASAATSREAEAEIARLRGELGKQMERAQESEERVATLEADVLAAAHGIETLSDAPNHEEASSHDEASAEPETPEVGTVAEQPAEAVPVALEPTPEPRAEPQESPVRQEWHPATEADVAEAGTETAHDMPAIAEAVTEPASADPVSSDDEDPPAPSGHDRYDDVWAAAFPTQSNGNGAEPVSAEVEAEPAEPSAEPAAEPAQASSATQSDDQASEPEGNVSVEDDLWALRARLAHADDDQERTPPAQSWS